MTAHSKIGASSAHRWLNCPGSIKLSEQAPPQVESSYAAEGTKAHELMEIILTTKVDKALIDKITKEYNEEMLNHAYHFETVVQNYKTENASVLVEQKVDLSFIDKEMFGTVDCAVVDLFNELTIIDYKYGKGLMVEPKDNYQLMYYALGLAHKYDYAFDTVNMVIVQPRKPDDDGGIVRSHRIKIDDLIKFSKMLAKGVKATKAKKPKFKSGSWCQFCPCAPICPTLTNESLEIAKVDFDDKVFELPEPQFMAPGDIRKLLDRSKLIKGWVSSVEKFAYESLQRGEKVEGYKLVEKRGLRKWNDMKDAEKIFAALLKEDAFKVELKSPTQMEKTLKEHGKSTNIIGETASKVSSGLTLAKENDKRQGVTSASLDFND